MSMDALKPYLIPFAAALLAAAGVKITTPNPADAIVPIVQREVDREVRHVERRLDRMDRKLDWLISQQSQHVDSINDGG